MIPYRYAYALSAAVLAGCQMVAAQPQASDLESTTLTTESAGPVLVQAAGNAAAFPPTASNAAPAPVAEEERSAEPRILRGTDRVIAPAPAAAPIGGAPVSFNFEEAPVAEVVRTILGDVLQANYVLHPPLSGTVTLATRQPISPDQAVFLLESALQANGLALLRDVRGSYHVGRPDALKGIGSSVRQVGKEPLPPGYGAIIVPLQYIGAGEMAAILRPMMPAEALVRVDTMRNLLVLSGTRTQAEGWLDLVNTFDVDLLKGMSVGVFPLKYVSVKEVEAALRLVSGEGAAPSPAPGGRATAMAGAAGQAAAGAAAQSALGGGNPLFGALRIMPIERLNSILVVTPRAAYLDEARRWIQQLDQPSDNGAEPQLFIYQVQNVNANHLANVLNGIFGGHGNSGAPIANSGVAPGLSNSTGNSFGQTSLGGGFGGMVGGGSGGFGNTNAFGRSSFSNTGGGGLGMRSGGLASGSAGRQGQSSNYGNQGGAGQGPASANFGSIRVMADELNNSVLVWSTRGEYAKIEHTLKRLDLPLTQVLIEASIVEVTLNDELQYGLQWAFNETHRRGYTGSGALNNVGTTGAGILPGVSGFSYAVRNSAGAVAAVLNALSEKTSVKVIASPSLMVLDNHSASIAVGDQTPIQGASTYSENGIITNSIQYKDTGVNLTVTPSVNAGNIVTMQVEQSVTDVGAEDQVTKQRAFLQRQLSSKVAVRSGESIVMGGLIQERSTATKSGIPILHTLPVVGNFFGSTKNDGKRTELIVIITPRVVRSDVDIREVSDDLRDRMQGLKVIELRERGAPNPPPPMLAPLQPPNAR